MTTFSADGLKRTQQGTKLLENKQDPSENPANFSVKQTDQLQTIGHFCFPIGFCVCILKDLAYFPIVLCLVAFVLDHLLKKWSRNPLARREFVSQKKVPEATTAAQNFSFQNMWGGCSPLTCQNVR